MINFNYMIFCAVYYCFQACHFAKRSWKKSPQRSCVRFYIILKKIFLIKKMIGCLIVEEEEWRGMGVQQSRGWEHYAVHKPEPHILLFRCLLFEEYKWERWRKMVDWWDRLIIIYLYDIMGGIGGCWELILWQGE